MIRSRIATAITSAVLVLGLSACGGGGGNAGTTTPADGASTAAGGGGGEELSIAIVSKGFQHQFWQAVRQGAEEAAEENNATITFEGPDTEANVAQQIEQLTTALNRDPDALGFAALDSEAAGPLLQQAKDKDIPVIAFDSGVDSDIPVTTVATDNKAAAGEAAKHMAELIGNEGKVAIVGHDQTSATGKDRVSGFEEWMKANASGVEIVDVQYGGGDHLKSADAAKAMIAAHPDLKGIYGTNEGSAIGVVNAINELGGSDLVIVGFDSGKAQMDAIRSGAMAGAITQSPVGMGRETVLAAIKAINGEELPEFIDTGFYWYDKENIDDEEIKANLYE